MEVLEALLALTLSMIIFSTLASVIVEAVHRFLAQREQGLRQMMSRFFDDVLWQRFRFGVLARFAPAMAPGREEFRNQFIVELTKNQGGAELKATRAGRLWQAIVSPPGAQRLTVDEFVRRLANTEIGQTIGRLRDQEIEPVIGSLAKGFIDHSSDARQYFRERARFLSVLVAIGLAIFGNIDASRLFMQFLREPSVARALLETESQILTESKAAQEALAEVMKDAITESGAAGEVARQKLTEVRQRIGELSSAGLAVGRGHFPYCNSESADPACKVHIANAMAKCALRGFSQANELNEVQIRERNECLDGYLAVGEVLRNGGFSSLWWLTWVLLTGLLIGLGGPFWFDFYSNLSRWVNVLRGLKNKQVEVQGRDAVSHGVSADTDPLDVAELSKVFKEEIVANQILGA